MIVPQEIADLIVDQLSDDKTSLAAIALAGRQLLERSRMHAYSVLSFNPQPTTVVQPSRVPTQLLQLLQASPSLTPHVKTLQLKSPSGFIIDHAASHGASDAWLAEIISLPKFFNVQNLLLSHTFIHPSYFPFYEYLLSCTSIKSLSFKKHTVLPLPEDLHTFFSFFDNLESLRANSIVSFSPDMASSPAIQHDSQHIYLRRWEGTMSTGMRDALFHPACPVKLSRLEELSVESNRAPALKVFLIPHLRHLSVTGCALCSTSGKDINNYDLMTSSLYLADPQLPLHHLETLSFTLTDYSMLGDPLGFEFWVTCFKTPLVHRLNSLCFGVWLSMPGLVEPRPLQPRDYRNFLASGPVWTEFDRTLSGDHLPNLRDIEFTLRCHTPLNQTTLEALKQVRNLVEEWCPILTERGILRIVLVCLLSIQNFDINQYFSGR